MHVVERACNSPVRHHSLDQWVVHKGLHPITHASGAYLSTMQTSIIHSHAVLQIYIYAIGELQVNVLNGSSGFLNDNKARYHRPTGVTALLEITKHMLLESPSVL